MMPERLEVRLGAHFVPNKSMDDDEWDLLLALLAESNAALALLKTRTKIKGFVVKLRRDGRPRKRRIGNIDRRRSLLSLSALEIKANAVTVVVVVVAGVVARRS